MNGRLGLGPAILFCPADRPDRYGKALERADAVILDLEDGVTPADRPAARRALAEFGASDDVPVDRVIVRVSPVGTADHERDVQVLSGTPFRTLMIPKAESVEQFDALAGSLDDVRAIALCETAAGVVAAPQLARHPCVVALMWGAEDLVVSLGGTSSRRRDGRYRDVARFARSAALVAAGAARIDAIDAVHVDLDDLASLAEEAEDAVASGFCATACLHPRQVPVVRQAYRPEADEVERARRVIASAEGASGAFRLDGRMIDEPLLAQARAVLRRAGEGGTR